MKTLFPVAVWVPFAGSLGYLSYQGGIACSLPFPIAAGLAVSLTGAGSAFAARFRSTRSWVDFSGMVLTLSLCTGFDFANLLDAIQRRAGAAVAVAEAGANAEAGEVEKLRSDVSDTERAWVAARDLAEAERTQGKVSGKPGIGSTFDRLTAEAANLEALLHRKETALRDALSAVKTAKVDAVAVSSARHLLAIVPPWFLLVAAAALELSCAGLAWSMANAPRREKSASDVSDSLAAVEPSAPLPVPIVNPMPTDELEIEDGKVIPITAEEVKILGRVARRAYRGA